jgi:hypothetical protein
LRPFPWESVLEFEARKAVGPWLAELMPWSLFPTFTYDLRRLTARPRMLPPGRPGRVTRPSAPGNVSAAKARRDAEAFFRTASQALRRQIDGVIALEVHKSGSHHMHGLLAARSPLTDEDAETIYRHWHEAHGYMKVVRIEGAKEALACAVYCAKYMTKSVGELVFSPGMAKRLRLESRFGRY